MTEDIISNLPDIFRNHICTLRKASLDDSNKCNMCESTLNVIHFDKIPNEYCRGKGWSSVPKSNDALYICADGTWYFVEFKNGSIDKSSLFRKLYDSIIMLIDLNIIPDFEFSRNTVNYILVYNSNKYPTVQESESRTESFSYILRLAHKEEKLFDVENFEKYLFKETHTYSKEIFESNFVKLMELDEGIA